MKRLLFILLLVIAQSVALSAEVPSSAKAPMEKLQLRMRHQMAQIQRDVKTGKLTKDQAKVLKAQVEAIRKQEITFLKQNGIKTLTDAQIAQLNDQLNTLSKSIPIR